MNGCKLWHIGLVTALGSLAACIEEQTTCEQRPAECIGHPTATRDLGDVASFYKSFASDEEAAAFYTELDRQLIAGALGRTPVAPIDLADPRYDELRSVASALSAAFKQVYPALSVLPAPRVVLLPVSEVNAAAVAASPLSDNKLPNLFFVNEGLLDSFEQMDEAQARQILTGLIGHELTHLYMRHADVTIRQQVIQAYEQDPGKDEAFGFDAAFPPKFPERTAQISLYQTLSTQIGPLAGDDFSGIRFGQGINAALIDLLVRRKADGAACAEANSALEAWLKFEREVGGPISVLGEVIAPSTEQVDKGKPLSDALVKSARACLAGEAPRYVESLNAVFPAADPVATAANFEQQGLKERYLAPDNNLDRLLALFGWFGELREQVVDGIDLATTRMYCPEEEADDVAMMLEHVLPTKFRSPLAGGGIESLFRVLTELTPACEAALTADVVPEYSLWSDHHSTCYRIFHARRMKSLLAAQR